MNLYECVSALRFRVEFTLRSSLNLSSGEVGKYADSSLTRSPDGRLFVSGMVWAGLIRRAMLRTARGHALAETLGEYEPDGSPDSQDASGPSGVSPLWCDGWMSPDPVLATEIRPGICVDRALGTIRTGLLYSEELVRAGLGMSLSGVYLSASVDDAAAFAASLRDALWVVDSGIENIGGGWSYGYGRLKATDLAWTILDLTTSEGRASLWERSPGRSWRREAWPDGASAGFEAPEIVAGWRRINARLRIPCGQLLAVGSPLPPSDASQWEAYAEHAPDKFVFRTDSLTPDGAAYGVVIPGKAMRQALLRVPCERTGKSCPDQSSDIEAVFGSTDRRGVVAVSDAPVADARTAVINRIHLCEHSMQNMNLFNGEYLTAGNFKFDCLIDDPLGTGAGAAEAVLRRLADCDPAKAPPGWTRLGATTTATGQIELIGPVEDQSFGPTETCEVRYDQKQ